MSLASRKLIQATAGAAGAGEAVDDDFANVVLLLDGDGTSGDNNETFTDSSANGFTVTENGSVVQGSFSPYGDNWSVYFDGASYLNTASGATALGTGAFTVEFWINTTDTSFNIMNPDSSTGNGFWGLMVQSGDLRWNNQYNLTNLWVVDGAPILDGQWHHVAIVSNSSVFKVFYDGVSQSIQSGSFTDSYNYPYNDGLRIGSGNLATFKGYLSNIRLVSGTAIYSSDFDVPTEPFTNSASYTEKLLACQSNRFIDNGNSSYSITTSGSPKVTPFSPFKDDDARDITTDGGSAYFSGSTGNYLDIPDHTDLRPSGDFTVEFWAYVTNSQNIQEWYSKGYGIQIYISGGKWGIALSASNNSSYFFNNNTAPVIPNMWTHVAVTRNINSYYFFINGEQIATTTNTSAPNTGSGVVRIGDFSGVTGYEAIGYISDVRYSNESAGYTSEFTPPTAPVGNLLGSAYSISAASYTTTFSVATQDASPRDVFFKPDGTKMYVVGAAYGNIYQYSLSTAWDVSTATYDSKSLSTSSEETTPTGMFFKPDGTSIIIVGSGNDYAFQYDLTTAWDVSTGSYASKSFDLSTQGTVPNGVALKPDGTKMFVIDDSSNNVFQYSLSTGWDLSTASYDSVSASVTSQASNPMSLEFNADGTKMYISDRSLDRLHEYILSTAWSVSSITHIATFKVNAYELNPSGVRFGDSGTKLYTSGYSGDAIDQYSVFSDSDLLLDFQDAGIYDRSGLNNIDTVSSAQIDTAVKKYGTGSIEFDGSFGYLKTIGNEALELGSGDWTIEFWVYFDAVNNGTVKYLFDWRTAADTSNSFLAQEGTNGWTYWNASGSSVNEGFTTSTFSASTWHHVAIAREGSNIYFFVDGTKTSGSVSDTSNYDSGTLVIGSRYNGQNYLDGYIDDFRITKGVARYTANFTPPTEALPKF